MNPPPVPPSDPSHPPSLPPGPPPMPQGPPAWQDPLLAATSKKRGTRPVFWILLGIILLVVISLFVAGAAGAYSKIVKGVKEKQAQRQAAEEMKALTDSMTEDTKAHFDETGNIDNEAGLKHMEKVQALLDKNGKGTSSAAIGSRAASTWTSSIGAAVKVHTECSAALDSPAVLDASSLKTKEEIAARRTAVAEFRVANKALAEVFANSEKDYIANLRQEKAVEADIPALTREFMSVLKKQLPYIRTVREQDEALAVLMLQWLDLVENEWGKWSVTETELSFENPDAEAAWKVMAAELGEIARRQREAQEKLLNIK